MEEFGGSTDKRCPEEDEKLLRRQQPSGRCIPGGGATGGIRSSQTFRLFTHLRPFARPQAAAINPGGHGIPLMSRLPAGFRQRTVPRRASPGAGNTDLLCCAPNQLFSCLPFSKSSISVDCESIILSTAFPRLCFPLSARAKAVPPSVPAVSVRMVHPDSQELDRERSPVPEGYTPYTYEFRDRHGKMQRERLFLKNTPSSRIGSGTGKN